MEVLDVPSVVTSYQQYIKPYHKLSEFIVETDKIIINTEFNIEHFTYDPMLSGFITFMNKDNEVVTEDMIESFFLHNKTLLLDEKEHLEKFQSLLLSPEEVENELRVFISEYENELNDPLGVMRDYLLNEIDESESQLYFTGEVIHGYDTGYLYNFTERALSFVNNELSRYDDEEVTI